MGHGKNEGRKQKLTKYALECILFIFEFLVNYWQNVEEIVFMYVYLPSDKFGANILAKRVFWQLSVLTNEDYALGHFLLCKKTLFVF